MTSTSALAEPGSDTGADPTGVAACMTWDPEAIVRMVGANVPMQQRLLDKFLLTTEKTLALIQQALAGGDVPELTRGAHSLKSAARTVGALALGERCAQLEAAGRADDLAACQALAAELSGLFDSAKFHIKMAIGA